MNSMLSLDEMYHSLHKREFRHTVTGVAYPPFPFQKLSALALCAGLGWRCTRKTQGLLGWTQQAATNLPSLPVPAHNAKFAHTCPTQAKNPTHSSLLTVTVVWAMLGACIAQPEPTVQLPQTVLPAMSWLVPKWGLHCCNGKLPWGQARYCFLYFSGTVWHCSALIGFSELRYFTV